MGTIIVVCHISITKVPHSMISFHIHLQIQLAIRKNHSTHLFYSMHFSVIKKQHLISLKSGGGKSGTNLHFNRCCTSAENLPLHFVILMICYYMNVWTKSKKDVHSRSPPEESYVKWTTEALVPWMSSQHQSVYNYAPCYHSNNR